MKERTGYGRISTMKTGAGRFFSRIYSGISHLGWGMAGWILFWVASFPGMGREVFSLAGPWELSLPSEQEKVAVVLPGTMDEWGRGNANNNREETKHLSRVVAYEGEALYRKEINIPESFRGKLIFLCVERTKRTTVFVDGKRVGSCDNLQTPHSYDLTELLSPGKHTLTVSVDNRRSHYPGGVGNSHAFAEHTQTNWNGMLGEIFLEAVSDPCIESINLVPDPEKKSVFVRLKIRNSRQSGLARITLEAILQNGGNQGKTEVKVFDVFLERGVQEVELICPMGENPVLWSEFVPNLYTMRVKLERDGGSDEVCKVFGMRRFATQGTHFTINGQKTFLRGRHDACVFPLTGYPPMDKKAWLRHLGIAASYGFNYVRFHTWTPPEAAFEAADELGMYLQPEMPYWGGINESQKDVMNFFFKEGKAILDTYASHPSFVMFALGNELSGTDTAMRTIVDSYRNKYPDILYSFGSNNHLGREGWKEGENFLTTCRVGQDRDSGYDNHVRSSFAFADAREGGILNGVLPSTRSNYRQAIKECPLPVIGHETGQFQIYPDFREIAKYTGVLKPWNLEVFRKRLQRRGMEEQAEAFHRASGIWASRCYKADIEMALRTPGFGGFQMLDLQDFPGQGTSLVGLLDAFMDNKGIIDAEEFSGFCHAVVPLALFDKYTWTDTENLSFGLEVANYGPSILHVPLQWRLEDSSGRVVRKGNRILHAGQGELSAVSEVSVPLSGLKLPDRLKLILQLDGTKYTNSYDLWVYSDREPEKLPSSFQASRYLGDEAISRLNEGASMLWFPDHEDMAMRSIGGLATPDYWNYAMFKGISESLGKPVSPGSLSLLMDPHHPLFRNFPTDEQTNWQWWSVIKASRPLILDLAPAGLIPVVQVVDNIERNHKLGLVFEMRVGKGKLLVCMANPESLCKTPEGKQLYSALVSYVQSKDFEPKTACSPQELKVLFSGNSQSPDIIKVDNVTDYR